MAKTMLETLLDGVRGNKTRHGHRRELVRGDVVCVEGGILKRYGIWTGENFILYGEDSRGKDSVHEEAFRDFLGGAEQLAICEFSEKYGSPTQWVQPVSVSSVVMPQDKLWRLWERARKARKYKRYSPHETVNRARSKLGEKGYLTSEHFAMWCKTGISESHELEAMRRFWDRVIVY